MFTLTRGNVRRRWAAGAVVAGMLALSACSGSGEAAEPGAEGGEGTLVVATTGSYRPMTFTADGTLQGYDIDWANIIGEELGMEVEFVEGQLNGLLTGLQSGRYDVVMSSLTITPERSEKIDFTTPYVADGLIATKLTSSTAVTDITDLDGLTVGITSGSGYTATVEEIGGYTELREFPGTPEAFADLSAGRIDTYAVGRIPASDYIKNQKDAGDPVVLAGDVFSLAPAGIGVQKGNTELKAKIDAIIEAKIADGTYDELCEKWFGVTIDLGSIATP